MGRPNWTPDVEDDHPGEGNHRRHVIPSHLLLQALCRQANDAQESIDDELVTFATAHKIVTYSRGKSPGNGTCRLLEAVGRFIHSNPRNLWPGEGRENTVIGFLSHDLDRVVRGIDSDVRAGRMPVDILSRVLRDWRDLYPGMYPNRRRKTLNLIRTMVDDAVRRAGSPSRALAAVRTLLQDVAGSLDFDLNQLDGNWRAQNEHAIAIYGRLYKFVKTGHGSFWDIVSDFMRLDNPLADCGMSDTSDEDEDSSGWGPGPSSSISSSAASKKRKY